MSDELIEAMARCIHAELSRANVMAYLDMPDTTPETLARALLPVIRAHLEPTSEMVEAGIKSLDAYFDEIDECSRDYTQDAVIATFENMLAASPIGDVVCTLWKK